MTYSNRSTYAPAITSLSPMHYPTNIPAGTIGVAHRVTKREARAAFNRGDTIAVSSRGHEPSFDVYPTTTVWANWLINWWDLEQQISDWSNRYTNQRYYIVTYHNRPEFLADICDAVTETMED